MCVWKDEQVFHIYTVLTINDVCNEQNSQSTNIQTCIEWYEQKMPLCRHTKKEN